MKTKDFEKKLQEKYPTAEIRTNPSRPGLANVFVNGEEVCPVPSEEIKEEPDNGYRYVFPNDMSARHNSIEDVYAKVEAHIKFSSTEEGQALASE